MDVNPNSQVDIHRLQEAIRWSDSQLTPFRKQHARCVKHYAGNNYGTSEPADRVGLNVFKMAVDIYQRGLVAKSPRCLVVTGNSALRPRAHEFEIALNHLMGEIDFGQTLRQVVTSAIFSWGVMKIGVTPDPLDEAAGYLHDAGQPFADNVLPEDFIIDMSAEHIEEIDYCGNEYRLWIDDVLESGLFTGVDRKTLELATDETEQFERERSSQMTSEGYFLPEEYHKRVRLCDVWLPKDNLVTTILKDGPSKSLRTIEWTGPERGPYRLARFGLTPGLLLPVAPSLQLLDMHELINHLFAKLGRQALRQRTVGLATSLASQSGEAAAVLDLRDGEFGTSDNPGEAKEFRFGGADSDNLQFLGWCRQMFSYMGGNLDAMGGLRSQSPTLGQERLLKGSSSGMLEEMQDEVIRFTKDVMSDIGYYLYTDPVRTMRLTRTIGGEHNVGFEWGPDKREADYYEFNIDIEPFSLISRSPGQRLEGLLQMVTQVVLPMQQQMQAAGMGVDIETFFKTIARYADLPELAEIITKLGVPLQGGGLNSTPPRQSPVTTRENVRYNAGAQDQSPEAMIQKAMGGAPTGQTNGVSA